MVRVLQEWSGTASHPCVHHRQDQEHSRHSRGSREVFQGPRSGEQELTRLHHAQAGTPGYTYVYAPLARETYGHLGEGAKEQIRVLADGCSCFAGMHHL